MAVAEGSSLTRQTYPLARQSLCGHCPPRPPPLGRLPSAAKPLGRLPFGHLPPQPQRPSRAAFTNPLPAHGTALHSRRTVATLPPTCHTRSFAPLKRKVAGGLHIFGRATASRGSGGLRVAAICADLGLLGAFSLFSSQFAPKSGIFGAILLPAGSKNGLPELTPEGQQAASGPQKTARRPKDVAAATKPLQEASYSLFRNSVFKSMLKKSSRGRPSGPTIKALVMCSA